MRLTPAQIGVWLICGERFPEFIRARVLGDDDADMKVRIKAGHDCLVRLSGKDFGYDLLAWHSYLKESRDGGYTYARNIALPQIMKAALASDKWKRAVHEIETEGAP